MKKIITYCIIGLSLGASAQIAAYRLNPNSGVVTATITNGFNMQMYTASDAIESEKIKFVNMSASTQTYNMQRSFVTQSTPLFTDGNANNKPNSYFCFGTQCFGSNVSIADPSNYTILTPGADSQTSGFPVSIYLSEAPALGYYVVRYKIFNVNNPNDTLSFNAVYNTQIVGIQSFEKLDDVSELYPNPNTGSSAISFDLSKDEDLKFQVYNSLGSLVYNGTKQKYPAGKNKLALDPSVLSNGVYFVTISSNTGKTTKRLIVSK
jgi:hypothetical protein